MTQPVAVVTDTTHYLPRALADMQEIHQVSLYVGWEDELERELEMSGFERFYERLRTDPEMPTTSQPSIGDFLAVWEPLIEAGRDIVSIHLASGLSGTYEAARQARGVLAERGLGDRIEVIDGETGAGGLGCLLLAAAASARSGVELKEVAACVHEARQVLKIRFCIDTLEYLQRGGRIGRAQAWLGITMKIKPILSFEREITPVARVRTAGRAFEHLVGYMREMRRDGADGWAVQHIRAPDQAERLVERGREIYGCEPLFVSEVGPVIGTYIGPGGLLIAGIPRAAVAEGARGG
ncbi:MAG TPA: DegV family protein, partial [Solirubrobacteraceae bacterium]|nr:DegV family protein [Solirubrobacteraceae bacterium]